EAGRSFFDPSMQLKVLFFAYCDGVRSCRAIAKHIRYDIRYRYFCGSLRSDFRTINRFRHDNLDLLGGYFAGMVLLFEELKLVDFSQLALDSSKFRAMSSACKRSRMKRLDRLSQEFATELSEDSVADGMSEEAEPVDESGLSQSSSADSEKKVDYSELSDPDARFMKTSEGGKRLSYNGHVVVEKNQVIIAADVSTNADDSVYFGTMVERTEEILGSPPERLLADGGYYSGGNISRSLEAGIDLYLPVSNSGHKVADSAYHRDAFVYDSDSDSYRCPQGETLHYQSRRRRRGTEVRVYSGRASSCGSCSKRHLCTSCRVRKLEISEHYSYERKMRAKLSSKEGKEIYRRRQGQVEPVFGNIKYNLGFTRFLLRRLSNVRGEFLLFCIAHNIRKLAGGLAFYHLKLVLKPLIEACYVLSEAIWERSMTKQLACRSTQHVTPQMAI
ncbi:MAG: IS1182 family transposase, partial [candidate division Zixibacteria bacterium]|nr:IS1182 family transposase [candidate division Zixibacteria bacterium]MBU1471633.1 IS1182 family transposase [candidate division Zixibacteria bacterium]